MLRVSGQIPKLAQRPQGGSRLASSGIDGIKVKQPVKPAPKEAKDAPVKSKAAGKDGKDTDVKSKFAPPKYGVITVKSYGPPPPPPGGSRRGGSLMGKFLAGLLLGSGGVVGYAWYDPDFRKQIEGNLPPALQGALNDVLPAMSKVPEPTTTPPKPKPLPKPLPKPAATEDIPSAMKLKPAADKEVTEAPKKPSRKEVAKREIAQDQKIRDEAQKREEARIRAEKKSHADQITKDSKALEAVLKPAVAEAKGKADVAIQAQKKAAAAIKTHTMKIKAAMDLGDDLKEKEKEWEAVTPAMKNRQEAKDKADKQQENAQSVIQKLERAIREGKSNENTKSNKALLLAEETLNNLKYDLNTAAAEVSKAESEARVMQEYKQLVKKGKEQFRKELESILPEVDINSGDKLSEEELNYLIAHAHRRIEQLRRQVLEATLLEQVHIESALDRQKEEDATMSEERVGREQERLRAQFNLDKSKWDAEKEVEFEERLRKQLARQSAAHSDHLTQVLKVQEAELEKEFQVILSERIDDEQDKFREKTARWVGRMGGIELALAARSDKEKRARKAQELWLACTAFQTTVSRGRVDASTYAEQPTPLRDEVIAIQAAGNDHPFVSTVTACVPEAALKRGVWTEEGLKERFRKVHRLTRRVAMIDERGGSVAKFALSYMQSWFVRDAALPAEQVEVDPDTLSTFAIVDTARSYLEKGDLDTAVRLMNQLKGEPRAVAKGWIEDARLLLETKQAAAVLLAHASSEGLGALVG